MAAASDDLGRVARERGIEGHNVFTYGNLRAVLKICLNAVVFPVVRKGFTKIMELKYLSISSLRTEGCSENG